MEAIDQVREVLHLVANLLVWPVFAGLLSLAAISLLSTGACAREAWERRSAGRQFLDDATERLEAVSSRESGDALALEAAFQTIEREAWLPVHRIRLLVRLGPAFGLMGTLIPMAYALQGLSEGDLPSLAGNLVTAFASTVIGLAISVIAFLVAAAREEWARADLQELGIRAEAIVRAGSA